MKKSYLIYFTRILSFIILGSFLNQQVRAQTGTTPASGLCQVGASPNASYENISLVTLDCQNFESLSNHSGYDYFSTGATLHPGNNQVNVSVEINDDFDTRYLQVWYYPDGPSGTSVALYPANNTFSNAGSYTVSGIISIPTDILSNPTDPYIRVILQESPEVLSNPCWVDGVSSPFGETWDFKASFSTLPVATFGYSGTPFCSNAANPSPTFSGGGIAGTFTSTPGLSIDAASGQVNLAASTPGTYTVTNTFAKSVTGTCDDITATSTITITSAPAAVAGTPVTACSNSAAVNITGGSSAGNYGTVTWTSNGTGTIANANSLTDATYTPGSGETGTITLTLTATGNDPCTDALSTKSLTITAAPAAVAGTPVTACSNSAAVNITGGSSAGNYGTVTWTSNGTGTIANGNSLTGASYIPGAGEAGTITLTLTATGNSPCTAAISTKTIMITPANTVTAASSTPTLPVNSVMTNITHTTTGATGIGTPAGLPAGVTAAWASNTITISGTPTAPGTFIYNVPLTGGCGSVSATGTIIITANNTLTVSCSNNNPHIYFGVAGYDASTLRITPAGGTAPYKVSVTTNRSLLCNQVTNSGDETWTGGTGTSSSSNSSCPSSGSPAGNPSTTANSIATGGSYSVTVSLMTDADITATVTDANGFTTTCTQHVIAEDARCFAGNSGNAKVMMCHYTGSNKNPTTQICIAPAAVSAHLAQGDQLGSCNTVSASNLLSPMISGNQLPVKLEVNALPNPTSNYFRLALRSPGYQHVQVTVVDILGRVVESRSDVPANSTLQLGNYYHPGVYFVQVLQGKEIVVLKLIKEGN